MANLNFTSATPTSTTKLVGFDSATAAGERTYEAGSFPVSTAQAAADAVVLSSARANTPAGNISATTVQAAINELDSEKAGLALANNFTAAQTIALGVTATTTADSVTASVNNFLERNTQNTSSGSTASSDVVVTTNTGSATTEFVDLGINGSGFSGAWGGAKDGYLYASDNNLWIGTSAAAKNVIISCGNAGATATATFASTGLTLTSALPVGSGGTGVTTSTGSGSNVLSTSPTLVTPVLGTPSSGTLSSCTGLPISTGVSGLAAGVATFLATPSSANLRTALTDETGSGSAVFATSPTLVTPVLGTPTSGDLSNCTASTLATTTSTTAPATTAFVQGVSQAENTFASLSISAAGDNLVVATTAQNRVKTTSVTVTAGTYTATITLQTTSALAGDMRVLRVSMPAGLGNNIDVRNATSGGTALGNCPMDGATARVWVGRTSYDGSAWGAINWVPLSVLEYVDNVNLDKWYANGYLQSDGATSNRAQIQGPFDAVNNPRGWVAGAASLTWRGVVTVPTSAPSGSDGYVAALGSSVAEPGVLYGHIQIRILNSGLRIRNAGSGSTGDYRMFEWTAFRTTYSGQTGILEVYFVQGTTNPVVRWNDVDISASFSLTTAGTPPDWLASSILVPTYHLTGYNWVSGPAPVGCFILGSLTDADRAFHRTTGQYPAWVVSGGSMKNEILSLTRNSNFSALATDFTAGPNCTVSAASGALVMTGTGSAGSQYVQLSSNFLRTGALLRGNSFRVKGTISANTTGGAINIADTFNGNAFQLVSGTGSFDITVTPTGQFWTGGFILVSTVQPASAVSFTVNNLEIYPFGALSLPGIQPCNVVDDLTTIGGNQARLVGVTPVTPKRDWRICADTFTNGNKQVLEGTLLDSTADVIDSIEQFTTGTPTTTVGSVSAGAQYKASSALSAGINPATLVTRKLATGDIWVNSNSTAQVRTVVKGHRAV